MCHSWVRMRPGDIGTSMKPAVCRKGEVESGMVAGDMRCLVRLSLIVRQIVRDSRMRVRSSHVWAGMETAVRREREVECGMISGDVRGLVRSPLMIG